MNLWSLFRRQPEQELTPEELRVRLVETAASGTPRQLLKFCKFHRESIAQYFDQFRQVPQEIRSSPPQMNRYLSGLIAAAQCLAQRLNDPRLLNGLVGTEESNPILRWDRAADYCEDLAAQLSRTADVLDAGIELRKRAARLRAGEPLCRIVVRVGQVALELDELKACRDGHFRFEFARNRPRLQKAVALARRG